MEQAYLDLTTNETEFMRHACPDAASGGLTMMFVPALHAEWIKIRTLRSLVGGLVAVLLATTAFSALAGLDDSGDQDFDPLFSVFFGVSFGQIAAITFGAQAVSAEFQSGALRVSLTAVPDRVRWFLAKAVAIAGPALVTGLVTGGASLAVGTSVLGDRASGLSAGRNCAASSAVPSI